ncbi:hypothetical protein DAEQUDRAFT_721592 [Daedalea quercina L-15889]|uniref:F-box domain-containing protein n=1 Tax=Daedalea quercina L-15889 TaxID=1314783 RepID=A0A165TJH2_9APHY|nr:hypothetical protein DAEQUDRAFT_721592 [Daedalea quercina L-15889]
MHASEPSPSTALDKPYTSCSACTPFQDAHASRMRPLRHFAPGPDGVDWNDCYWGYGEYYRPRRRTVVRPLPWSIASRIPLELTDHIISFLRWETKDLYNCALVCRAWYRRSQVFLYGRIVIDGPKDYNALKRFARSSPRSGYYLPLTRTMSIQCSHFPLDRKPSQYVHAQTIPLVFGGSVRGLKCLMLSNVLYPPYHNTFFTFMSRFTEVVHLRLGYFTICSFGDLRRIICSLPKLCELQLLKGKLTGTGTGAGVPHNVIVAGAEDGDVTPHLCKLHLQLMEPRLLSLLASWITSMNVCKHVTTLVLGDTDSDVSESRPSVDTILQAIGPSLTALTYVVLSTEEGYFLGPLASCTGLLKVKLSICVDPIESWRGIVAALHETFSQLFSAQIRTLELELSLDSPQDSPDTSPHSHNEFAGIDMVQIHESITRSLFDSLRDVRIDIMRSAGAPALTSDAFLTATEMDHHVRLILQPWDKRGILGVTYEDPN